MLTLYITDNKLEPVEYIIPFSLSNKTIDIMVNAPMISHIYLTTDINGKYNLPMYFKNATPEGNVFTCELGFLKYQIDYLKEHPNKVLEFTITINNSTVEGTFKGTVHPQLYSSFITDANIIKTLQDKILELNAQIKIAQISAPAFDKTEQTLYKGMVPIATGLGNSYVWDYPFNDMRLKLLEITSLVTNLATQNTKLTERINDLETKLLNHLYEEYQL